jgi:hypothetical protein
MKADVKLCASSFSVLSFQVSSSWSRSSSRCMSVALTEFCPSHSPNLTPLDFFFWEGGGGQIIKQQSSSQKNEKCGWLHDNHKSCSVCYQWNACQYLAKKSPDVCCVMKSANTEIYWTHKTLFRSRVWPLNNFSNTVYGWQYTMFHLIAI